MKVAIYIRVSKQEQAQKGLSLTDQEETCRAMAKAKGFGNAKVFRDPGYSAGSMKRPGIQALMEWEPDVVIISKIDRLSRKIKDFLEFIERYEIISVGESFDTSTPAGRMMRDIIARFAEFEREQIGERTNMGKRRAAMNGRHMGTIPIGYRKAANPRGIEIDPVTGPIIRNAFGLYAEGKLSLQGLVDYFNENNLKPARSKMGWERPNALRILTRESYKGIFRYGDIVTDAQELRIVSDEIWDAVQEMRYRKRTWDPKAPRPKKPGHLLRGIIKCCGRSMMSLYDVQKYKDKVLKYNYYRCTVCRNRIRPELIDPIVIEALTDRLLRRDVIQAAKVYANQRARESTKDPVAERKRIKKAIAQKRTANNNIFKAIERKPDLVDAFADRIEKNKADVARLEDELGSLKKPPPNQEVIKRIKNIRIGDVKSILQDHSVPVDKRRRVIANLVERIDLNDGDLEVTPALPGIESFSLTC